MKNIGIVIGVVAVVFLVVLSAGCTTQVNSVAQVIDPVIGSWESSLETSYLDLNFDGKGTRTVLGISEAITWTKSGTDAYIIDGSRYTLEGNTLKGPIATYHKV